MLEWIIYLRNNPSYFMPAKSPPRSNSPAVTNDVFVPNSGYGAVIKECVT